MSGNQQSTLYKGYKAPSSSGGALADQPIEPGATLQEIACGLAPAEVVRKRPATGWDFALGWLFGAGVGLGNAFWKPSERYRGDAIQGWQDLDIEIVVPIRQGEEITLLRVPHSPTGVEAERRYW